MKKPKKVLIFLSIFLCFQLLFVSLGTFATGYVESDILSGYVYDAANNNELAANYAAMTKYDYTSGTAISVYFFPAIISHAIHDDSNDNYYVTKLRITVSGTKPNGQPISSLEFTDKEVRDSPHTSGSAISLPELTAFAINHLTGGAYELLRYGAPAELQISGNDTYVWVEWNFVGFISEAVTDKGLEFRFALHCDPDLPGTYYIHITYYVEISAIVGNQVMYKIGEIERTQTLTYTLEGDDGGGGGGGSPPVIMSIPSTNTFKLPSFPLNSINFLHLSRETLSI